MRTEQTRDSQRKYYLKNKAKILEKMNLARKANPNYNEFAKEYRRLNKDRARQLAKIRYAKRGRGKHLQQSYGITQEQYDDVLLKQGGVCAICERSPNKVVFHVDHSHETGAFRGLLCGSCNKALGMLKDDSEILIRASNYIIHHKEEKSYAV
jgi:hypothetical protein